MSDLLVLLSYLKMLASMTTQQLRQSRDCHHGTEMGRAGCQESDASFQSEESLLQKDRIRDSQEGSLP